METFWFLLVQFLRYSLLYIIICLAAIFSFMEAIILAIGRHPKGVVGNAMGAPSIVKTWAKINLGILRWIKKYLRKYVKAHHPRVYRILSVLF